MTVQQALARLRPVPGKSEFETTEAFRARALAANQGFPVNDAAILLPLEAESVRYDADTGVLRVGRGGRLFWTTSAIVESRSSASVPYISIDRNFVTAGTYTASNMYGARTEVVRRRGTDVGVTMPELSELAFWPRVRDARTATFTFSMSPDEARAAQRQFAVLAVGPLEPPFVLQGTNGAAATMQRPVDVQVSVRMLSMRPSCFALVNRATGRVMSGI